MTGLRPLQPRAARSSLLPACSAAAAPRGGAGRPRRLRPGVDRRLGHALGRGAGGRGRHDPRRRRQRRASPGWWAPPPACSPTAAAMVVPGFMDGHLHFTDGGFQLASVDLRPAEHAARSSSPGSRRSRRSASRASGSSAATGTTSAGPARRSPAASGSTRSRRTTRCSCTGSTATWRWPTAPRSARPRIVARHPGHPRRRHRARSAHRRADRHPQGQAMDPVDAGHARRPPTQQRDAALRRALAYAASKGVTAVAHVSVPLGRPRHLPAGHGGAATLTARVALYFPLRDLARGGGHGRGDRPGRRLGLDRRGEGLRRRLARLDHRAVLRALRGRSRAPPGVLTTPEDSLRRWIGAADSAGLQVAVHAIGERANGLLLDIYDSVARAHGPRDRRFRIEHAQHLRAPGHRPHRPERRHRLDAALPRDRRRPLGREADRAGADQDDLRVSLAARPRSAHLAFGSDWTVAPIDPLLGIYAAVTRRTLDGKNPGGLGAGGEDHGGGSAAGLHRGRRLRRLRRADPRPAGARATRRTWCCSTRT